MNAFLNLNVLYVINTMPITPFNILTRKSGIDVLNNDNSKTAPPRNNRVERPAENPKTARFLFVYPCSMAFEAKRLVQKMMVNGLEIVSKNAETKLDE